eukprot:scaffold1290_cov248-Ochromonas_danica.AAC.10
MRVREITYPRCGGVVGKGWERKFKDMTSIKSIKWTLAGSGFAEVMVTSTQSRVNNKDVQQV